MLKQLFIKAALLFGKEYSLDPKLPATYILGAVNKRVFMLLRGVFKKQGQVFIGKKVKMLNTRNIEIGKNSTIENYVVIDGYSSKKVSFGQSTKIGAYTRVLSTSQVNKLGKGMSMGANCSVGDFSFFGCAGGIKIGDNVIMGQYVSFHSENHNFTSSKKLIREQGVTNKGIVLGHNIWVGSKVTFLDGAALGGNNVVAAGAVVKDKFPKNVLIGGVPARILKHL